MGAICHLCHEPYFSHQARLATCSLLSSLPWAHGKISLLGHITLTLQWNVRAHWCWKSAINFISHSAYLSSQASVSRIPVRHNFQARLRALPTPIPSQNLFPVTHTSRATPHILQVVPYTVLGGLLPTSCTIPSKSARLPCRHVNMLDTFTMPSEVLVLLEENFPRSQDFPWRVKWMNQVSPKRQDCR